MKKLSFMSLSVVTVLALVACGGSSSSSTATKIGTGYYVDNAVAGVDYVCGTKSGKTGEDGKFIFEEGKECKFSLAGIPLRTTNADELVDGQEVFEDNPKVAQFLQSIDANNDLSDGIQITDEVLTALTTALETSNSTGTLPEGTVLTEVVAAVGHDVAEVTGDVRTDEQVQEHLAQTQTEITKALLSGKTFYVVDKNQETKKFELFKSIVNKDVTSFIVYELDGTVRGNMAIEIVENKMIFTDDRDGVYALISQKNGYILVDNRYVKDDTKYGLGTRLYASQSDAQAYFDTVKGDSPATLSDLIIGKTYYTATCDSYTDDAGKTIINNHVETLEFKSDGKSFDISWIQNGETKQRNYTYSVNGDKLTLNVENGESIVFTDVKDSTDSILFSSGGKFYKNKSDAQKHLDDGACAEESN